MHFAAPLPAWLGAIVAAAIIAVIVLAYRRPLVPLSANRRLLLAAVRAAVLAALVFMLARPTILVPPDEPRDRVVPVLVDLSRSMRVTDAVGGGARVAVAGRLLRETVLPSLSRRFTPELYGFGDDIASTTIEHLVADARRSDLNGAIAAIKERYRGRPLGGIVILSDGGDTEPTSLEDAGGARVPIYAIGVGSVEGVPDREVIGVAAGDPRLDSAAVDLRVSAVSRGFGREPFQLRLLGDGRVLETTTLTPHADGSPVIATFTVTPNPVNSTVYTADIAATANEPIVENNQRSVMVSPPARRRRVLAIQGAPGYDHSFFARAIAADSGLELDLLVRKGRNDAGQDTYFVQAGGGRAPALMSGFPASREALFAYDAIVIANVESEFFTRAQLQMMADFVSERGGGLLVFGGRAFAQRGLMGTPLEEVLPVELNDRRGGLARASLDVGDVPGHHEVTLTAAGGTHPIMRLGPTEDESRRAWAALPPLAAAAPLGGPRPGATVLAVTATGGGVVVPLVAIQRYGRGRAMLFGGEAAWRWRMLMPTTDRSYEFFWRQSLRWLSESAPEPVELSVPDAAEPGDRILLAVDARDGAFAPVPEATVAATLMRPGGDIQVLPVTRDVSAAARFTAELRTEQPGLYRWRAEARRGAADLGSAERWFLVGGADREFVDPRLNEGVLRRIARASGGRYAGAEDAAQVGDWLDASAPAPAEPEPRDLWHDPRAFIVLLILLSAEWILRRRWGMR